MTKKVSKAVNLHKYTLCLPRLEEALRRQETGAIELRVLLEAGKRADTTIRLFAAAHGISVNRYLVSLLNYLLAKGIIHREEEGGSDSASRGRHPTA